MAVVHVILALMFAPLLAGFSAWCRFLTSGGLSGPPSLMGRYAELKALFARGTAYGQGTQPLSPIVPVAVLSCLFTALSVLPLGGQPPQLSFNGDFFLLTGLLALIRLLGLLASRDGSPVYRSSLSGFKRGLPVEPLLLPVFLALGLHAGSYSFFGMVSLADFLVWQANQLILILLICAFFLLALGEEMLREDAPVDALAPRPGAEPENPPAPSGKNIIGVKPGGKLAKLAAKKDALEALWNKEPATVIAKGGFDRGLRLYGDYLKLWIYAALVCALVPHSAQDPDLALAGGIGGIFFAAALLGAGRGLAERFPALTPKVFFGLAAVCGLAAWVLAYLAYRAIE